jgi:hypothetical protein
LYRSLNNIIRVRKSTRLWWTYHVARMEKSMGVFNMLTRKPTEKRLLGRPRHRWEDNICIDPK